MTTLDERPAPAQLELNDIGRVTLRTSAPVLADRYARNRVTGAFILIDEHTHDTVGAGMIDEAREREPQAAGRRDVIWHPPRSTASSAGSHWACAARRSG